MMNTSKKIICFILSIVMVFACMVQSVFASSDEYFAEANSLLKGLGFEDATSKVSENISRDEFVNLLASNSYYDYSDKAILAMSGVYSDTNYYFHPDSNITLEDAVILCVRTLGISDENTDYFEFMRVAQTLKLLRGIDAELNGFITYRHAYILMYNYLTADLSQYKNRYPFIGNSILNDKYDIYTVSGIVDAAGMYSLSGKSVEKSMISINGVTYKTIGYGEEYFGRYVTAYVVEKGRTDEIIALSVSDMSKVSVITPDNDAVFSNNTYEYTDENGKINTVKISVNADVFRNGGESRLTDANAVPESGMVTIINNGTYSGGADVVIIESAQAVKVSGINKSKEIFYSKGSAFSPDEDCILMDNTGKELAFGNVEIGDIWSVYVSDTGFLYKAIKLTASVSGVVTGYGNGSVTIGGTTYRAVPAVENDSRELIAIGATLMLDIYNTAVYIDESTEKSSMTGIILDFKLEKGGFEDKFHLKIYTESGVIAQYLADEDCTVNSAKFESFEEMEKAIPTLGDSVKVGIVRYNLNNEGMITELDFPSDKIMDADSGADIYKTGEDNLKNLSYITYKKWSEIFGEGVFIEPSTKVFRIPKQESDGTIWDDEALYSVFTCSSLTSGTNYTATSVGYSLDKNDKVADYVIIRYDGNMGAQGVSDDTRLSMVGSVSKVIKPDGDEAEAVKIYNKENPGGRLVYGKTDDFFSSLNIEAGDLIRINYISQTSTAKAAELVYKKGAQSLVGGGYIHNGSGGGVGKVSEIRLCKVLKNWNPVVDLVYANVDPAQAADSDIKPIKASLYTIFRYNEKTKKVETAAVDELISYDLVGNDCSVVVFDDRWLDPFSIFIVK